MARPPSRLRQTLTHAAQHRVEIHHRTDPATYRVLRNRIYQTAHRAGLRIRTRYEGNEIEGTMHIRVYYRSRP